MEIMQQRMRHAARLLLYSPRQSSVLDAMVYELARIGAVQHCARHGGSDPAARNSTLHSQLDSCSLGQFVVY